MLTNPNRLTLYMTPEDRQRAEQVALALQGAGVNGLFKADGALKYKALWSYLIDDTDKQQRAKGQQS